MRILILGGDGYLGWPTSMHFASRGHEVMAVDSYFRRQMAVETSSEALIEPPNLVQRALIFEELTGKTIAVRIGDCSDFGFLEETVRDFRPEVVVHYAEQPSAPFSMIGYSEAKRTLDNNIGTTFNLIWAILRHAPDCHIIKLGTMGEYGTPDIDIEEGWIEIQHKGRSDTFLFPRQPGSLYHATKVFDTDLLWLYVRTHGLRVTDLMQGPVYGIETDESAQNEQLVPNFHYDDIFGTVVNRFLVQAVVGVPLTVYGAGGQTRGYLNLRDTLQCVDLAAMSPPDLGQLKILNQFTEQFSVNQLAERVRNAGSMVGLSVQIGAVKNPRKEKEEHYYRAAHSGLIDLGLQPHLMSDEILVGMMERIIPHKHRIDVSKILPRVSWS